MEAKVFAKYMLASKAEGCHITPHKDTTHRAGVYIYFSKRRTDKINQIFIGVYKKGIKIQ